MSVRQWEEVQEVPWGISLDKTANPGGFVLEYFSYASRVA